MSADIPMNILIKILDAIDDYELKTITFQRTKEGSEEEKYATEEAVRAKRKVYDLRDAARKVLQ